MIFRYGVMKMPNNNKYCPIGTVTVAVYMAMHKIRSRKKGIVMSIQDFSTLVMCDVEKFASTLSSKGFEEVHVIARTYTQQEPDRLRLMQLKKTGMKIFIVQPDISNRADYEHFEREYYQLSRDRANFLPSRDTIHRAMKSVEDNIEMCRNKMKGYKQELEDMKTIGASSIQIKNIVSLPWVENYSLKNNTLIIDVKEMSIIHCPPVYEHFEKRAISTNEMLYNIAKLQCKGYRFVALPQTYKVNKGTYELNVQKGSIFRYIDNFLSEALYFGGTLPHIGVRGSCYGEFSSNIAQAQKLGFDMFMYGMQTYLQSVNFTDPAGKRIVMLPMKKEGSDYVIWPAVDSLMRLCKYSMKDMDRTLEGYNNVLRNLYTTHPDTVQDFVNKVKYTTLDCMVNGNQNNVTAFRELLESREPGLAEQLRKENIL